MKSYFTLIALVVTLSNNVFSQQDKGKDYPFIDRLDGFYINNYNERPAGMHEFVNPVNERAQNVNGDMIFLQYRLKAGAPAPYSFLLNSIHFTKQTVRFKTQKDEFNIYYLFRVYPASEDEESITTMYNQVWVHQMIESDKKGYSLTIISEPVGFPEVREELNKLNTSGRAELYTIYFKTNKYQFEKESDPTIDEIIKFMNEERQMKVTVIGSADTTGSKEYNLQLSEKRAAYIKNALIEKGINASRLKSKGVGETNDKKDSDKEKELQLNRRTVLLKEE